MSELIIPPAPSWFNSSVVACAPDNTLVYGTKYDIVVIRYTASQVPVDVKIYHEAHKGKQIISVSLNKKWDQPNQHLVSLGEDNKINVWDLKTGQLKMTQNKEEDKDSLVGAVFAGDDRVISVTNNGAVSIWNINTGDVKTHKKFFGQKVTITCLSPCPHASYLVAFGLYNGAVAVADLRRDGRVLYKMSGHHKSVIDLAWCPSPINIFPQSNWNTVGNKKKTPEKTECEGGDNQINKTLELEEVTKTADNKPSGDAEDQSEETVTETLENLTKIADNKPSGDAEDQTGETVTENSEPDIQELGSPCSVITEKDTIEPSEKELRKVETEEEAKSAITEEKTCDELEELKNEPAIDEVAKDKASSDTNLETTEDTSETEKAAARVSVIEEPRQEYLLASIGKDMSIYIWRGGTDGRLQNFFPLTSKKSRHMQNSTIWAALCWVSPNKLLTSSLSDGEILEWTLPRPIKKEIKPTPVYIHDEKINIFNIVTSPVFSTEYDWQQHEHSSVWFTDRRGKVVNFDLKEKKVNCCINTISAYITAFSACPQAPNRLAISQRDGYINIWDTSCGQVNQINFARFYKNVLSKLTTIAWHPIKEHLIGFGTETGSVGFLNMNNNKVVTLPFYFNTTVHRVEWGPSEGNKTDLALYAVSEGKVIIYYVKDVKDAPSILDVPDNFFCYKFSWKPDFSMLLLNGKDGTLLVMSPSLQIITTLYVYKKNLLSLEWHPESISNDKTANPRCNWFAAATNKGLIVYDCDVLDSSGRLNENQENRKIVANLTGHARAPTCLAWSPFDPQKIVSAGPDGLLHVWDISQGTAVATFVEDGYVKCPQVIWSPLDEDMVIYGERCLVVWNVTKHPPKIDPEFINERKRIMGFEGNKKDTSKSKKTPKNWIVPPLYSTSDECLAQQVSTMKSISETGYNHELDLDKTFKSYNLFGSREQVLELMEETRTTNQAQGKHKYSEMVAVCTGNIGDEIRHAIQMNRVTPLLISLAPMVSPQLWKEACEAYAKKLAEESESDPLETATYFLACHKTEEAITSLCVNQMFREALALAKCRLPLDSPIIEDIMTKWALHCVNTGNFELATHCYMSLGRFEEAAKVLARRNVPEFLEFAVELATKANNSELAEVLKGKLNDVTPKIVTPTKVLETKTHVETVEPEEVSIELKEEKEEEAPEVNGCPENLE